MLTLTPRSVTATYVAAFVLVSVLYAAVLVTASATPWQAVRNAFAVIGPNALCGLLTARLSVRVPSRARGLAWTFATQASIPLFTALLAVGGWVLFASMDSWLAREGFTLRASRTVASFQFLISLLIQAAVLTGAHAWNTIQREATLQTLRARSELASLRSQLNPHFVLNLLHALVGLVRRDPRSAEEGLERLGELLRYGMRVHEADVDAIGLRDEWDFVEKYLQLEQLRFGDRLRVSMRAAPEALAIHVPPFALQPLVENAVRHGISPHAAGGAVDVSAEWDGRLLRLRVRDTGGGADSATILASPRLGLRLLRRRLDALYGAAASLRFDREPDGFVTLLELPVSGAADEP